MARAEANPNLHRRLDRAPLEGLWPGDFVRILERNLHPRFWSIGIESTIYGNNPRKEMGLDEMGTIWVAEPCVYQRNGQWLAAGDTTRDWHIAMPKHQIPPLTIKDAWWDDIDARWKGGELKRGWRPALEQLIDWGILRPSAELTYLVGKDSRTLCRPEHKII